MYPVRIRGTGSYLPKRVVTNEDLEKTVNTNDKWIRERTGIHARHRAEKYEATSDLSLKASLKALEMAKMEPKDIDMILMATSTPDYIMPSTACLLQEKLKAKSCVAFDIMAACSGFIYILAIASEFIKTGRYQNILLVGGEVMSSFINYDDRKTCVLFGDGAGAVLLSKSKEGEDSTLFSHYMSSNGGLASLISIPAGGSQSPTSQETLNQKLHYIQMDGPRTFKEAVHSLIHCSKEVLKSSHMTAQDVHWMLPHQANKRIIDAVAKQLEVPMEKVIVEVEHMGNTAAATIPIALDLAVQSGRIQRGHVILASAFGSGVTSGSFLLRY